MSSGAGWGAGGGFPREFVRCDDCGSMVHHNQLFEQRQKAAEQWQKHREEAKKLPPPRLPPRRSVEIDPSLLPSRELSERVHVKLWASDYLSRVENLDVSQVVGLPNVIGTSRMRIGTSTSELEETWLPRGFHAAVLEGKGLGPRDLRGLVVDAYLSLVKQVRSEAVSGSDPTVRAHLFAPLRVLHRYLEKSDGPQMAPFEHWRGSLPLPHEIAYLETLITDICRLPFLETSTHHESRSLCELGLLPGRLTCTITPQDGHIMVNTLAEQQIVGSFFGDYRIEKS
jgi:hypothetical protein